MFTGLVEQTGTIVSVEERSGARRITVAAPGLASRLREGDSVAVSGVCLTALDIEPEADPPVFHADLAQETVNRTSLAVLQPGSEVNLELPTAAGSPLGGHVVQGHVDGVGSLVSLEQVSDEADPALADWWLKVTVPENVTRFMIEKGSIAIEGISLTIASFEPGLPEGDVVTVAIIPHTYLATNLHTMRPGRPVNIEADVLVKFAAQQKRVPEFDLTEDFLLAQGY
ncbi:MAG TPA: riboflavin synthase [Acidisarcina sp.]|nr:riboflavin synthase [Acidisarcina sp.]